MSTSVAPLPRVSRWWWVAALLALLVAAYSLRYVVLGERAYVPELAESFRARPWLIATHALFGPIALLAGLANLLPAMRRRSRWGAHRWVGRIYLGAAVVLGGAGLALAFHAAGGASARAGFLLLAVATIATTLVAYLRIRRGAVRAHREWMLRSYALIFGAVTLRLWMPILVTVYGGEFLPAYRWVAWLSWVPNLAWAEWTIRRGWRPRYDAPERFGAAALERRGAAPAPGAA
jgi:hypothetical protein